MGLASGGACSGLESLLHPRAAERVVWNGKNRRLLHVFLTKSRHLTQEPQMGPPHSVVHDVPDPPPVRGPSVVVMVNCGHGDDGGDGVGDGGDSGEGKG